MSTDLTTVIAAVVERMPSWVRQDLSSNEPGVRARAEETLTTMIGDASTREAGFAD